MCTEPRMALEICEAAKSLKEVNAVFGAARLGNALAHTHSAMCRVVCTLFFGFRTLLILRSTASSHFLILECEGLHGFRLCFPFFGEDLRFMWLLLRFFEVDILSIYLRTCLHTRLATCKPSLVNVCVDCNNCTLLLACIFFVSFCRFRRRLCCWSSVDTY